MSAIFLSASVPLVDRGTYHETANPFLIQCAVRELVIAVIKEHKIVWGGHPAITPMIWNICEDMGVEYSQSVILYQSRYFEDWFPNENKKFDNVVYVDAVNNDREESLLEMRNTMLSRTDLDAAVFIGGMDGSEEEFKIFKNFHPNAKILPVAATGGAAKLLADGISGMIKTDLYTVDFASMFFFELL
ncbi:MULTISPECIES: hypothetical protein [Pectobacterium]|uniref:SLOG domain-containing protein n=1 Tax=Pectobacterium TaxID=122277 RepID=UPI0018DA9AA0|nr:MULTISPECIES: hypothetical protein [Pectobacterium]MBT9185972.1 hypothetical protein [Pectobacterium punjabense]QPI42528.1 hypothetical protein I2D83_19215 [Pectobacterium aroidearum]